METAFQVIKILSILSPLVELFGITVVYACKKRRWQRRSYMDRIFKKLLSAAERAALGKAAKLLVRDDYLDDFFFVCLQLEADNPGNIINLGRISVSLNSVPVTKQVTEVREIDG